MRPVALATLAALALLWGAPKSGAASVEIVATDFQFPKGAVFVGDTLYFTDYVTSDLMRMDGDKVQAIWRQEGCGPNGLTQMGDVLIIACSTRGAIERVTLDGALVDTIEQDDSGENFANPTDLAADNRNGFYFTNGGDAETPNGKIYYRAADRSVKEVAAEIAAPSGLAISPDGKSLYVSETQSNRLLIFAIADDASLSGKREFVKLSDILLNGAHRNYSPNSLRVGKHGNIFISLSNDGGFAVIDPQGKLVKQVELPGPHHAGLAISPDGKFIYVTTTYDAPDGAYRGDLLRVSNPVTEKTP